MHIRLLIVEVRQRVFRVKDLHDDGDDHADDAQNHGQHIFAFRSLDQSDDVQNKADDRKQKIKNDPRDRASFAALNGSAAVRANDRAAVNFFAAVFA